MIKAPDEEMPELFSQASNVIELNLELIRGPEVFFQPSLVGVDQVN